MAMVGSDDILGLLPLVATQSPPTDRLDTNLQHWLVPRFCPSRFPSVHGLLLVTVGAELHVLGIVRLLVHVGDGEIIWGPVGLDIGMVDFLM